MKRLLFVCIACMALTATQAASFTEPADSSSTGFGSFFKGLFGGKSSSTTATTTSTSPSTTTTNILSTVVSGLTGNTTNADGDIVTNVLSALLGASTALSQESLVGTWNYDGFACVLESENALSNIGGTIATDRIEEKVDGYLGKIGVKSGSCSFTFNNDNTCTFTVLKRKINGTYTLDATNKTITFTFAQALSMTSYVARTGNGLQIVFKANKLLALIKSVSSYSSNTTLSTISALLSMYQGMMMGMELKK